MGPWYETNLALIENRHPDLEVIARDRDGRRVSITSAQSGSPTALVTGPHGDVTLHSRFDPVKKSAQLADIWPAEPNRLPVVLGLGLGYHLLHYLSRVPKHTPVIVVEPDTDVFRAAISHTDLSVALKRPSVQWLVGLTADETIRNITRLQLAHSLIPLNILVHPPSIKVRPDFYQTVRPTLESAAESSLGNRLIRPRFEKDQVRILLLNTGYYLIREVRNAIERLGHQFRQLNVENRRTATDDFLRMLLAETADFNPDFVLTVNHLGFDRNGVLTDLLTRLKLPAASWFVDSPLMILNRDGTNRSPFCSIFLWDSDYISEVKTLGFENVHYLPLATDEQIFRPDAGKAASAAVPCDCGFVGDSMAGAVGDKKKSVGVDPELMTLVDRAALDFLANTERTADGALARSYLARLPDTQDLSVEARMELTMLITWRATQMYRLNLVQSVSPLSPTIVGDSGWKDLLNGGSYRLHPPLDYYKQLPGFYSQCHVNLNATSQQMKTGVNQRVFDVPASGGFLITDHRDQLAALFEPGREAITYDHPEEALDLTRYYLTNDAERRRVTEAARNRILNEHTYCHRVADLIVAMRRNYT
jgi:spore maturation protein CgeB